MKKKPTKNVNITNQSLKEKSGLCIIKKYKLSKFSNYLFDEIVGPQSPAFQQLGNGTWNEKFFL